MTRFAAADSFAFKDAPAVMTYGLLLPAVQKAETEPAFDDFAVETGEEQIALLLPAVQQAREAARRTQDEPDPLDAFAERAGVEPTPFTLVELLVV